MVLGAVAYLVVILYFANDGSSYDAVFPILWTVIGWNAVLLIVTILVIVDSVRKVRAGKTRELATSVFVVKLAAIPFFLVNFALLTLIYFFSFLILLFGGPVLQIAVTIGACLTYLAMLSTSVYGWASIVQLRRERRIDTPLVVLYVFLLLIFVWDIVAGILLFADWRRSKMAIAAAQSASLVAA